MRLFGKLIAAPFRILSTQANVTARLLDDVVPEMFTPVPLESLADAVEKSVDEVVEDE